MLRILEADCRPCARLGVPLAVRREQPASGSAVVKRVTSFLFRANRLNMLSTLFLAAVLAGPVHAQVCSGGNGGGVDATGNQCNAPNDVAAYTNGSGITSPAKAAKMSGVRPSGFAVRPPVSPAKMSGALSTPTVVAQPASRLARAPTPPGAPVKTTKIDNASASPCSGGAYGGMDVNGNQCDEPPTAAEINLAARRV